MSDALILDVGRARRDTPAVAGHAHLNNAGAALPPTQVTDAVIAHLRRDVSVSKVEYALLDLHHRQQPDLVRASVHDDNTDDELDRPIAALAA